MKIGGINITPEILKAYRQNTNVYKNISRTGGGDTLEISAEAREMLEFQARLKDIDFFRSEKVDQLKREISGGTYRPDAEKIAEGILKEISADKDK